MIRRISKLNPIVNKPKREPKERLQLCLYHFTDGKLSLCIEHMCKPCRNKEKRERIVRDAENPKTLREKDTGKATVCKDCGDSTGSTNKRKIYCERCLTKKKKARNDITNALKGIK